MESGSVRQFIMMTVLSIAGLLYVGDAHPQGDGSNWGKITQFYVDAKMSALSLEFLPAGDQSRQLRRG